MQTKFGNFVAQKFVKVNKFLVIKVVADTLT